MTEYELEYFTGGQTTMIKTFTFTNVETLREGLTQMLKDDSKHGWAEINSIQEVQ